MFIFPAHRFNPDPVKADVVPRVISGGTALSGEEDVIQTDGGGRWEISYGEMDIDGPDLQRLWDAWTGHLAGGAQSVLVPLLSLGTAPRPAAGRGFADPSDIWADDDYFPTEVRFAAPHIVAVVGADAALRATTIEIVIQQGSRVRPGVKFSIGPRAYKVGRVTARDDLSATCIITPPLREPVTSGATINFDWPVVEARAALGQDLGALISLGMFGTTAISFVEHFTDGG